MIRVLLLLLLLAAPASAQIVAPGRASGTGGTLTVSSTAVTAVTASGGSATYCASVDHGLLLYVITNSVYLAANGATPSSSTGLLNAGDWFFFRPWTKLNMIRTGSSDATLWAQCMEGN